MADLEKTVKIIFAGEDKALSAAIDKVSAKFNSLSTVADTISAPLARAADGVLKVDAALAALAVGGLAYSLKTAGEFSTQFAEITTLFDDTGAGVDKFREDILNSASGFVKPIEDINKATYAAISAGIKYKDALNFVSEAEKLSVAGKADLQATTTVLVSTLNAYGESVEQAGKYSDILFQTVKIGQTTLPELAGSLSQVTSIAAAGHVPFEVLGAAIAAMTAKGMPTEQAIVALKGALTSIISPASEAQKTAAALGIEFSANALAAKGLDGVLRDVMKATGGNIETISALFGNVRGLTGVLSLGADDATRFTDALTAMKDAAGSTAGAYEKMVNEFENVNQRLVNNLKITFISIGDNLTSQYGTIVGGFSNILKGMNEAVKGGAFDPLFDLLDEAGAEFAKWLEGVAKALPEAFKDLDFSKLVEAIKSLGAAFGKYFGDLDLTKVEDLHDFIQLLIDGITGLVRVTTGMVDAFRPFFKAVADFLKAMADSDEETQKVTGQLLAFGKIIRDVGADFFAAVKILDKYGVSIEGLFKLITGGAQIMWNGLQILGTSMLMLFNLLEKGWMSFLNLLSAGALSLLPSFQKTMQAIEARGHQLRESLLEDGMDARRGLDKMIDGLEKLGGAADKNAGKVKDATKSIADIPDKKVTTWELEFGEGFKKAIDDISKEFVRVADEVKEELPDIKVGVQAELDFESVDGVHYILGNMIPDEKKVDVNIDTQKVEAQSEIIKGALEWRAKVDISEVEEKTKQMQIMFDSLGKGLESSGDILKTMFSDLKGAGSWEKDTIMDQIKSENAARKQQFDLQKKLIESEVDYNNAKTKAMNSGQDFMIKIEAQGLEPHIEAFLWKILEKIQVRGNAEAAEFLLGWNPAPTP